MKNKQITSVLPSFSNKNFKNIQCQFFFFLDRMEQDMDKDEKLAFACDIERIEKKAWTPQGEKVKLILII